MLGDGVDQSVGAEREGAVVDPDFASAEEGDAVAVRFATPANVGGAGGDVGVVGGLAVGTASCSRTAPRGCTPSPSPRRKTPPAANSDDAASLICLKISFSTHGFCERSQKNQVRAADVVSRPARVKLMTMSVTNFASVWPELKNRESRSTDPNTFASLRSRFFSLTMAFANSRTSDSTARRRFSDPIPRALSLQSRLRVRHLLM
ncbi:hypothetical protein ACFX2B_014410 [Malus domestica]